MSRYIKLHFTVVLNCYNNIALCIISHAVAR